MEIMKEQTHNMGMILQFLFTPTSKHRWYILINRCESNRAIIVKSRQIMIFLVQLVSKNITSFLQKE